MIMQARKEETPATAIAGVSVAGRPKENVHVNSADVIQLRQAPSRHNLDDLPHPLGGYLPPWLTRAQRLEAIREFARQKDPRAVLAGCEPLPKLLSAALAPYVRQGSPAHRIGRRELNAILRECMEREAA